MKAQDRGAHKVMLVDDDEDVLKLLSTWLKAEGIEVVTAGSGAEAMASLGTARPDLVITDLKMEGMSGMEVLAEIHRDNPLLPVIMLSGQAQIPDAVKATHLGSAAFLTKPISMPDLVVLLWQALTNEAAAEAVITHEQASAEVARAAALYPSLARARPLLELFEIEKALYELRYELRNRPDWVAIPLRNLVAFAS